MSKFMYDVITVGSNTVDVFAKTDSELIEIKTRASTEELLAYPLGTKILISGLEFMIGGGGTNTAVAFSRLGFKTAYLGKIGQDENGLKVFKLLKDENIDFIGTLGKIGGYSVILDSIEDDRTILTFKGCNDDLTFEEIKKSHLNAKWLYFASMTGKSFKMLKKLTDYAKKNNIKIAFNASSYLAKRGYSYIKKIVESSDVFILNLEEAQILAGKGSAKDLLKRLYNSNMQYLVITDGQNGAYCTDGKNNYFIKPKKHLKIKETTGAGDAFASTFVAGIIRKKNIKDCLRMAAINAESVISNYGAKNILLSNRKLKLDRRPVKSF